MADGENKIRKIANIIAVVMSLYHILYMAHIFEYLRINMLMEVHRAFHVAFAIALVYLLFPFKGGGSKGKLPWYHLLFAAIAVITPLYVAFTFRSEFPRWFSGRLTPLEIGLALLGIVVLLEAARRVVGLAMAILAGLFFLYALYGNYFPGFLEHRGFSLKTGLNSAVFSETGIFGSITGISATVVIMFVLFGQFLLSSGAGDFFIKLAYGLMGRYRGGPAKIAIVASMFFGMISGSTVANVATVGTFTIPLMKKTGYPPAFAGGVEAVASNGGQFTPPIMGAVAFIMAEWLEMSYWSIALAALIPALLYYVCLYVSVDIEAIRLKLKGLPASEIPSIKNSIKIGWIYLFPVIFLIYLIAVLLYPPETASLYSIGVMVIVSWFRKETRMGPRRLYAALVDGAKSTVMVAIAIITAQLIVSAIMLTGLGPKVSSFLMDVSGGNLFLILTFAAIASFVFGMGMTTIPIYMVLVPLITPAVVAMGVPALASHLFVFWWGLTSNITPPVCPGVFVSCAIAGSKMWQTGINAVRMGILTFVLPFIWIYKPALLLIGSPLEIILASSTTLIAVIALGFGISGFMLKWWQRIILLGSVALLVSTNLAVNLGGVIVWLLVFAPLIYQHFKQRTPVPIES